MSHADTYIWGHDCRHLWSRWDARDAILLVPCVFRYISDRCEARVQSEAVFYESILSTNDGDVQQLIDIHAHVGDAPQYSLCIMILITIYTFNLLFYIRHFS